MFLANASGNPFFRKYSERRRIRLFKRSYIHFTAVCPKNHFCTTTDTSSKAVQDCPYIHGILVCCYLHIVRASIQTVNRDSPRQKSPGIDRRCRFDGCFGEEPKLRTGAFLCRDSSIGSTRGTVSSSAVSGISSGTTGGATGTHP